MAFSAILGLVEENDTDVTKRELKLHSTLIRFLCTQSLFSKRCLIKKVGNF